MNALLQQVRDELIPQIAEANKTCSVADFTLNSYELAIEALEDSIAIFQGEKDILVAEQTEYEQYYCEETLFHGQKHAVFVSKVARLDTRINKAQAQLDGEEGYYALRDVAREVAQTDCDEKFRLQEDLEKRTNYTYRPFDISTWDPIYKDWALLKGWNITYPPEVDPCVVQNILDYREALANLDLTSIESKLRFEECTGVVLILPDPPQSLEDRMTDL